MILYAHSSFTGRFSIEEDDQMILAILKQINKDPQSPANACGKSECFGREYYSFN